MVDPADIEYCDIHQCNYIAGDECHKCRQKYPMPATELKIKTESGAIKMKVAVNLKIDVTKIDKARLFRGQKGTYLDATVFIDIDNKDQYDNNGMITQSVSKEEKEQGVKGNILGNVQVFWREYNNAKQSAHNAGVNQAQQVIAQPVNDFDDSIPF